MKQRSLFAWIWRLAIVGFGSYGLYLQLWPNQFYNLTYYTLISNVLIVVFWIYLLFLMAQGHEQRLLSHKTMRFKGGLTISILLTFLVYAILLAPVADPKDFYHWKNYTLHYIVPVMVFIDWLVFDRRHAYRKIEPVIWTILPLAYMVFSLIKGYIFNIPIPDQKHSPYPYFFMNITDIGWMGFLQYAAGIFVFYMLLGYLMYAVKMFGKKKE